MKKIVLLLIVAAVVAVFAFDLHSLLTLDSLKSRLEQFREFQVESPGWLPVCSSQPMYW